MTDTASAALKVKEALVAVAVASFDPTVVLVGQGFPTARDDLDQVVAFFGIDTKQTPGPMSTNRSRDEDISVDGVISVFKAQVMVDGSNDDDKAVEDAAWGLLRTLEAAVRRPAPNGDPTLGGIALWCFLTSAKSFGYTAASDLSQGRLCEIDFTFTARVRITG
jgi:hypothetical protein